MATAALTLIALALVLPAPGAAPSGPPVATDACNGSRALCDRRLDAVVFPATHNSYSAAAEPGWLLTNQRFGISRQLRDGIRALLIDVHRGVRDPESGRVRTDLEGEGSSRNKVARELSPEALRIADRVAGRVGLGGLAGAREPFLCHALCELGSEPLGAQFEAIARFLAAHPGEVIVLFVEPYVEVGDIEHALGRADLLRQAARLRPGRPLPTLGDLVRADTRLVVFTEEDGGARDWYLPGFEFVQDTPLTDRGADESSCDRARGRSTSPMLLVNHWADAYPPKPSRNERIGGEVLERRLERCRRQREQVPNLVAVDFYERTGVIRIARELNERPR